MEFVVAEMERRNCDSIPDEDPTVNAEIELKTDQEKLGFLVSEVRWQKKRLKSHKVIVISWLRSSTATALHIAISKVMRYLYYSQYVKRESYA